MANNLYKLIFSIFTVTCMHIGRTMKTIDYMTHVLVEGVKSIERSTRRLERLTCHEILKKSNIGKK